MSFFNNTGKCSGGLFLHGLNLRQICRRLEIAAFALPTRCGGFIHEKLCDFIKFQFGKCFLIHMTSPVNSFLF